MKKKPRNNRPRPGQVWVCRDRKSRTPSRRIVSTVAVQGKPATMKVCYSTGHAALRWCRLNAFREWVRRYKAVATRTRRPRTMVLRSEVIR